MCLRFVYKKTQEDVRIGDRVLVYRLFRRKVPATVVYLPGVSPPHPELEYEDIKHWAMRLDNGQLRVAGCMSEGIEELGRIELLARGDAAAVEKLTPSVPIEPDDNEVGTSGESQ
jgi:uncharacterized protein (UPF0254 family)